MKGGRRRVTGGCGSNALNANVPAVTLQNWLLGGTWPLPDLVLVMLTVVLFVVLINVVFIRPAGQRAA